MTLKCMKFTYESGKLDWLPLTVAASSLRDEDEQGEGEKAKIDLRMTFKPGNTGHSGTFSDPALRRNTVT